MKRFILTSLCTLGLSLLGALGINQNNSENELFTANNTSNVNQNNADGEESRNLPTDNITPNADNVVKDINDSAEAATPQENISTKETGENAFVNNSNSKSQSAAEQKDIQPSVKNETQITETTAQTTQNTNNYTVVEPALNKNSETETVTNTAAQEKQTQVTITTNKNNAADNTSAYVYKNVDLSDCNSVNDVVSKLRKSGYTNITGSNIQNISSLEGLLNRIQNNGSSDNNYNTTPTSKPTQAPAPTSKPTQAPEPTSKPTQAPTKAPAPTAKPSSNTSGISNYANQVLQLVNQERAKAGLSAFTTNSTLTAAANKRAQETVQSFSHTRPNGLSFSTVLQEYNVSFRTSGENIAYGQRSPQEVVNGWMNSPGHRANILNANFNKIGIGVYQSNGVIYWTQLFTN